MLMYVEHAYRTKASPSTNATPTPTPTATPPPPPSPPLPPPQPLLTGWGPSPPRSESTRPAPCLTPAWTFKGADRASASALSTASSLTTPPPVVVSNRESRSCINPSQVNNRVSFFDVWEAFGGMVLPVAERLATQRKARETNKPSAHVFRCCVNGPLENLQMLALRPYLKNMDPTRLPRTCSNPCQRLVRKCQRTSPFTTAKYLLSNFK